MFYTRLKEITSKHGTTPTALSRELGLSTGNVGSWAKGKTPSIKVLQKIADKFNTTTDYLLGNTDNPNPISVKEVNDDDIKFALFGGEEGITDEMYEDVKAYAEFIKNKNKKS